MASRQSKTPTIEKPKKGPTGIQKNAPKTGIRRKSVSHQPDSASKTGTETDDSRDSPRQDMSKSSTDVKSPTGTPPPNANARVYARTSNNEPSGVKVSFLKDKTPTSDQITSSKRLSPVTGDPADLNPEEMEVQPPKVVIPTFRKGSASMSSNKNKLPIRLVKNKSADNEAEKNLQVEAKKIPPEVKKNLPIEGKKILPTETKKNLLTETRSLLTDAKNVKVEAKKNQLIGANKSITAKQTRISMKDTKKPPIVIKKGSLSINVNNSEPRNRIKFSSNDPRVGLNNSSDRNNNQVNEDEDEGESAAPEDGVAETSEAATGVEEEEPPAEQTEETSPAEPTEAEKSEAPEGEEAEVVEPEIEKIVEEGAEASVVSEKEESKKSKGSGKSKLSAGGEKVLPAGDSDILNVISTAKSAEDAGPHRSPNENFINLVYGIEVYELCGKGNYITLKNTSGEDVNMQNTLIIQKYEDSPYAVFKFPLEEVLVEPGKTVTVWSGEAEGKKDNVPTDYIFEAQKYWAGDINKVKIIVSEIEEGIFQYLTSPKITPVPKKSKAEGEGVKAEGEGVKAEGEGVKAGEESRSGAEVTKVGGEDTRGGEEDAKSGGKEKKGSKGLGPCGGMMGGDGRVTCESLDSMSFGENQTQGRPKSYGDERSKPLSPKKSRICELKTFDLSTICDDFDTRDKDGLTNCILCSCLVKKPIRHLEIMCEDDDDGENMAKVTQYSSEGPSDNDDPCEKYCKMMKAKNKEEHAELLDDVASNRSVEAWGKPQVDFGKGKDNDGDKKPQKSHDDGHRLDDNFCKEFGCAKKDTGGESENEKEGNAKEEDGGDASGGNNFDKFNKFMKDICNEFNMDFSKDKSEKKSGDGKKSGGNKSLAADNSCSVICKRNGNGRKQGDEGESPGKFSAPVQDNQAIKDLCNSIKGFSRSNGEKVDKSDDLRKGKKTKSRKDINDDDSCRGMCNKKDKGNEDVDDSGSDYHSSSRTKMTKSRGNRDNDSCSKACLKKGNNSDSDHDNGKGRKGHDSDDSYGGGGYKNTKQRGSYQRDSCSNLCSKGKGSNGSDSHERNGTKGHGRSSGNICDELCHGTKKSSTFPNDEDFYKEFCESLEKEKGEDTDCSKFYFCGSCNKNFSNCDPLTQEEILEMEKKKKQDEEDATVRRCCKMDSIDIKTKRFLKDNDCRIKSNDSDCEDPLLEKISKLLSEGNFSCDGKSKWEFQETNQVLKTADQLCRETLPKEELDCSTQCKDTFTENKYKLGMAFFGEKEKECCESDLCELLGKLKQFRELRDVDVSESEESDTEECPVSNSPVSTNPMFDLDAFMSDNFDECLEGNRPEVKKPAKKSIDNKNKNKNHCNGQHEFNFDEDLDTDYEPTSTSRWMWNSLKSFYSS